MDADAIRRSYADAEPRPFWLDRADTPQEPPPLDGDHTADLLIVGGGLTGLWAALLAREDDPGREVVLLEGERIAFGASGRNGGFMSASLTHGIENGAARWPEEMPALERLARENFTAVKETIGRHGIDADLEETGELSFATAPYQAEYLPEMVESARFYGWAAEALGAEAARAEVSSPTYHGAVFLPDSCAVLDPARLAWGLAAAARTAGVRVFERSQVTRLEREGSGVLARTGVGAIRARRAILATSAFPPLVRAIRRYVVPVWDYVLVTEPLDAARREVEERASAVQRAGEADGSHLGMLH